MSDKNWRPETDAGDYFLHRQKQLDLADRRPVIRKASDLVGPGIGSSAVRITDFNDLLATFNGYYSSEPGAASAPNALEAFIGQVISDSEFGGQQKFTGLSSGAEYSRTFQRSPVDPEALAWGQWAERRRIPSTMDAQTERDTSTLSGTAAMLLMPHASGITGDQSAYEWTPTALNIRKQGVYTGMVQVGDRVSATTATIALFRPQGSTTTPNTHINVAMAGTFYIPFTVIATDASQAFYVTALQSSGATRDLWWRMSITRIGDAV